MPGILASVLYFTMYLLYYSVLYCNPLTTNNLYIHVHQPPSPVSHEVCHGVSHITVWQWYDWDVTYICGECWLLTVCRKGSNTEEFLCFEKLESPGWWGLFTDRECIHIHSRTLRECICIHSLLVYILLILVILTGKVCKWNSLCNKISYYMNFGCLGT